MEESKKLNQIIIEGYCRGVCEEIKKYTKQETEKTINEL